MSMPEAIVKVAEIVCSMLIALAFIYFIFKD